MNREKQRFDLVNLINTIAPKNIEFHLNCRDPIDDKIKTCNFLGPNTNLPVRLADYDRTDGSYSQLITPPVNDLDSLALSHDIAYSSKDLAVRHQADRILLEGSNKIIVDPNTDPHTRRQAQIVSLIISTKLKLGLGYSWGSGAPDVGALLREARLASQSTAFQATGSHTFAKVLPLLALTAAIGIPAVLGIVSVVKKAKSKKL